MLMNKTLALIDKKIDELKNKFYKNNHFLELTESEYKILKKSFIPDDLLKGSDIISYRGISIKIKTGEKRTKVLTQNELPFKAGDK